MLVVTCVAVVLLVVEFSRPRDSARLSELASTRERVHGGDVSTLAGPEIATKTPTDTPDAPTPAQVVGRIVGRTLRADGRPVSATIIARQAIPYSGGAGDESRVAAGPDGRFEIVIPRVDLLAGVLVIATLAPSLSAAVDADAGAEWRGVVDVGDLILIPLTTIDVSVLADEKPVAGAAVQYSVRPSGRPADVSMTGASSGWRPASFVGHTDLNGRVQITAVVPGQYRICALIGEAIGEVDQRVGLPLAPHTVTIHTRPGRRVRVRVIDELGGEGLAGCGLDVWLVEGGVARPAPLVTAVEPTAIDGWSTILGLPLDSEVRVEARGPGWRSGGTDPSLPGTPVRRDEESVVIRVRPNLRISWPVQSIEGPPIEEGTVVTLTRGGAEDDGWSPIVGHYLQRSIVVESRMGHPARANARLPDGRIAFLDIHYSDGRFEPTPTDIREPRTLVVRVLDDFGGDPAVGVGVRLCDPSGYPLCPVRSSGPDGRIVFGGLPAAIAVVKIEPNAEWVDASRAGLLSQQMLPSIDLTERGDAKEVDVRVPHARTCRVSITLDGVPGVPEDVQVLIRDVPASFRWRRPSGLAFDGPRGRIEFTARPSSGGTLRVSLASGRYCSAAAELLEVDGTLVADFALTTSAGMRVRILPPRDGQLSPSLERWNGFAWERSAVEPGIDAVGTGGLVFDGIAAGRYRVRDSLSGLVSSESIVRGGDFEVMLVLDAQNAGWAEGTLSLPPDVSDIDASVSVTGPSVHFDDLAASPNDRPAGRTVMRGRFRVRVPGDDFVVLRAVCPGCEPDPTLPELRLRLPESGLHLALRSTSPKSR